MKFYIIDQKKKDIWLINKDNELIRFIFNNELKKSEVDANIYNIIKNEVRLKKVFKLSSLKIKVFYFSAEENTSIEEYKKYKLSNKLLIERLIIDENNKFKTFKKNDDKFVDLDIVTDRYKNRIAETYLNKNKSNYLINFYFNFFAVIFIVLFSINFLFLYYSANSKSLYQYIDYNYQDIITGHLYKLFTNVFVIDNIQQLIMLTIFIFFTSLLLGENIKFWSSSIILLLITFICNLFVLFGYFESLSIVNIAFFGLLGSIFILELNRRNNNLKFIYSIALPVIFLFTSSLIMDINFAVYMFSFVLGIFIQIALFKKPNIIVAYSIPAVMILIGMIILLFNIDLKSKINNYRFNSVTKKIENRLKQNPIVTDDLDREILSKNKSIITYYELGMLKISNSSITDAKKIFIDGINFDDTFAPIYYQLALIEKAEGNSDKSLEYAERALSLNSDNQKYKDLKNELQVRK